MTVRTDLPPADAVLPSAQTDRLWSNIWWAVTATLAALWLWTRVTGLSRSLWWDEVFTARRYIAGGAEEIFDPTRYSANNHVLFSLLSSWTTRLLGTEEAVIRLWVIVPALAATAVVVWLLWRRMGQPVAVLALGLVTFSWFAAMTQTEARGYALGSLAAAVLLAVTVTQAREPTTGGDALAAVAGAVGMLSFPPVMMLYLSHAGVWLLTRREHKLRLVAFTAASGLVTGLVLRPLLSTMLEGADRVGSRRADPVSWWSPVIEPLGLIGGRGFEPLLPGPESVAFWVAVVLGVLGLGVCFWRDRALAWQLLAALAGTVILLGVVGFHLRDRYIAFLLPQVFAAMAVGLAAAFGLFRKRHSVWGRAAVIGLLVVIAVPSLIEVQHETNEPLQDFKGATAGILDEDPAVTVSRNLHQGYRYYLEDLEDHDVVRAEDGEEATEAFCDGPRPAVYVPNPDREPGDVPDCLDDARLESVPHRGSHGEMRWYVLD
jgi:hypothetical protein